MSDAARRAQQMSIQANNYHSHLVQQAAQDRQRDGYLAHQDALRERHGHGRSTPRRPADRPVTVRVTGPGGTGFQIGLAIAILLVFGGLIVALVLFALEERENYRRPAPAEPTGSAAAPSFPPSTALVMTTG
jgi:hypothetical protein